MITNTKMLTLRSLAIGSFGLSLVSSIYAQEKAQVVNKVKDIRDTVIDKPIQPPVLDGLTIAALYQLWTGKRVIVSNAAREKVITFNQQPPMTFREAAELLEKTMLLEGLVFVASGDNLVKLMLSQDVPKTGATVISDEALLPKGDQVVTYVMKLDNISPDEALRTFSSVVKQLHPHGSIVSQPNTNALVITENTALIRTLIKLKASIDIPQTGVSRKMIQLEHADAEQIAESIKLIVDSQIQQNSVLAPSGRGGGAQGGKGNVQGVTGGAQPKVGSALVAGKVSTINVIPDTRTNRIFVMGRPIDILFAEALVKDFDQPAAQRNFSKFVLKYVPVGEFLTIAQNGIERIQGGDSPGGRANNNQRNNTTPQNNGRNGSNGSNLAETGRSEVPQSVLTGKTLLVADSTNNTLLVQGPPQSMEIVKNLVSQMDIPSKQVQITAIFGRYTMDGEKSFGVDWLATYKSAGKGSFGAQNRTGFPLVVDPATMTNPDIFTNAAAAIPGLSLYGQIGNNFFPYIRALQATGKFKLLARPTIFTTNNRRATLSSGQRIAVPTNTLTSGQGNGSTSQNTNIEFRDVLLNLEVIPLVNSNDEVTLQISFLNDNVVGSQTINGNAIPTIGTEEIQTTVRVPNNGTIVLGGLITERETKNKTGIPILSSIPGIGTIFSSETKETLREELVIFIQPRIIDGPAALADLQKYNATQSQVTRDMQRDNSLLPPKDYLDPKQLEEHRAYQRKTQQNPIQQPVQNPSSKTTPRNRFRGERR